MWITLGITLVGVFLTLCHDFSMRIFILVIASLMFSCAHQTPARQAAKAKTPAKKVQAVALQKQRVNSEEQDFERERAQVLAKRGKSREVVTAHPQTKRLELTLSPGLSRATTEKALFDEIQDHYEKNDEFGFQSRYQAYERLYGKSPRLSEVHYMAGLLNVTNRNYVKALKAFDAILMKNPKGPDAPKALFAKAIVYKKMNLPRPSKSLLQKVQARYPGSIESQRAALELKIQAGRRE